MSTLYQRLGEEAGVTALSEAFYRIMAEREPALAAIHLTLPNGEVHPEMRARFALFLMGWLGGPQTYMERHGHPRLRMRHGRVKVDLAARDAWLRAMSAAMDERGIGGDDRVYLDGRFAEVADFMRNTAG